MIENTVVFTITDVSDSPVSSQWWLHLSQLLLAKLSSGDQCIGSICVHQ